MTFKRLTISFVAVAALVTPALASAEQSPSKPDNASRYCHKLRTEMGADAFRGQYGTNHNKANAHGKCVSEQRKHKHGLFRVALKACKAEYEADAAAFLAKYGEQATASREGGPENRPAKPENGGRGEPDPALRKAMHNCVKAKVAEQIAAIKSAAKTCKEERSADPVAFRAKYGSNRRKRNAFGKCVVQHVKEAVEAPEAA
jgi:hypothetical protein